MGAETGVVESGTRSKRTSSFARVNGWVTAHPVLTVFLIAMLVRTIAVFVFAPIFSGSYVLDDGTYADMAEQKAANETQHWDNFTHNLYYRTASFMIPLTTLFKVFGPSKIVGGLYVALLGAGTAALVTRLAMEVLERKWAITAGVILAFLPSQVLWSSLMLKDAAVWFVLATLALIVAVAARSRGMNLALLAVATAAALYVLGHLRLHTLVVAAWALILGSWVGDKATRWARLAGGIAIAVTVPWVLGLGPAGLTFVANSGDIAERRFLNAQGANSAIVEVDEGTGKPGATPPPPAPEVPAAPEEEPAFNPGLDHLPRGITVMLFEPVPWSSSESVSFRLAQAESLVWYPIVLLGAVGLWLARRHLRVLMFPILAGGGVLFTYALAEGNIGTAFRHRGEFVWVVVLLAAFGMRRVRDRWSERRTSQQSANA
jgi:4-amino-4-deoxy-L-arabinose transferase-like glycosyltransferase